MQNHSGLSYHIIQSFTNIDSNLRGTIALGVGSPCPDIRQVIHWGPLADLDSRDWESW